MRSDPPSTQDAWCSEWRHGTPAWCNATNGITRCPAVCSHSRLKQQHCAIWRMFYFLHHGAQRLGVDTGTCSSRMSWRRVTISRKLCRMFSWYSSWSPSMRRPFRSSASPHTPINSLRAQHRPQEQATNMYRSLELAHAHVQGTPWLLTSRTSSEITHA